MFAQFNAIKIIVGLLAIVGGYLSLGGVAGATPLKIDFTEGGPSGTLQAGYQEFMHNTDGGELVTKPLASDMGIGGTVDVSISGNTHWRSYAEATGTFAPQSDLLRDGPLCNAFCTMTLGLDHLIDGIYEITTYHHTTQYGPTWYAVVPFDISLTDAVVTDSIVAPGVEVSDNASASLSTETFQFTVTGGSPVEIDLLRAVSDSGTHTTLTAVDIDLVSVPVPEPGTLVLILFGAAAFVRLSLRRGRRRRPA